MNTECGEDDTSESVAHDEVFPLEMLRELDGEKNMQNCTLFLIAVLELMYSNSNCRVCWFARPSLPATAAGSGCWNV